MTLRLAGVLAEARSLWRANRALILPLGGVFLFLPLLGLVLLVGTIDLPAEATPDQMRAAMLAFTEANQPAIFAVNIAVSFGTFALLNLLLLPGERTLGQLLGLALRRFLPFLLLDLIVGLGVTIGLSLLIVPGLFIFARTWLAAPAYAAAPESGLGGAFRAGWRRSGGSNGFVLLGAALLVLPAAILAVLGTGMVLAAIGALAGGGEALSVLSGFTVAAIAEFALIALTLIRAAGYRLSEPRQGI
jgi:hypothetical protein